MKKLLLIVLIMSATSVLACKKQRYGMWLIINGETNSIDRVLEVISDGTGGETVYWYSALPQPLLSATPSCAEAQQFFKTSELFRVEAVATDTNVIKEVRQDLKALKLSLTNIVSNINTNPAFSNPQGKILKDIVNALESDIKANLKLLRDVQ